ncbi:MAG: MmcQ/YjbR family DNA-binding protein [Ruminococcus sp.]|nr:MmcQ/YjbR family DNA-binding protein [Ruminococcus sp.]
MTREELKNFIKETYGVTPDNPWLKSPSYEVFRHSDNKKWFAVIMDIPESKLGINSAENISVVNLKCDTIMIVDMLSEKGIYPAYHMNKSYWVTAALDGSADDETIKMLTRMSFKLTETKKKG